MFHPEEGRAGQRPGKWASDGFLKQGGDKTATKSVSALDMVSTNAVSG